MKLKYSIIISSCLGVVLMFNSCGKSFLDQTPRGVLDEPTLATEKGVNKLLLAAYAMLDGHDGGLGLGGEWGSSGTNFLYGDIGGGIANKGSSFDDQGPNMSPVQRHDIQPGNGAINDRWKAIYEGVKRTNTVMQVLAKATTVTDDVRKKLAGQARFLRAFYHFEARKIYEKVPYLDEVIDAQLAAGEITSVANDVDIYPKIVEDAKYAWENLPELQSAIGLANKWAAGALYGKILMFTKDFATAKTVLTDVVNNGKNSLGVKYDLNTNYDDNFNLDFDNSKESVFAFQASSKDNAGARNANWGDLLNTPATAVGGAGFFTPTYFFANQFKTGADGLPVANPLNNEVFDVFGQAGLTRYTGNVDTRLDWTIGRDGVEYHDWGTYLTTWPRATDAGPYAGKKTMIRQSQVDATHDASVWFVGGGVALNVNLIRFADVILLLAEAEVEAGTLANATTLVNRVRNRAKASRKVTLPATSGTVSVEPYPATFASQDAGRKAVRLERLLELGMEGHRFFDLVRWGIASQEINAYYQYETGANFTYQAILRNPVPAYTSPSDDYYPIPQQQIDLSNGIIKQR